jgi:hypothetical protein
MIDRLRVRATLAAMVPILLAAGLFLGGCESEPTAPHDPTPTLSEADAAAQAGYAAMAVSRVGPEIVSFSDARKNTYQHTFTGDVVGTVWLDFRLGGAAGAPSNWSTADWARLYTATEAPLTMPIGIGGSVLLAFDITADIDQSLDSAVLGGGGTFQTGVYEAAFSFTDLAVTASGAYPTGGTMTFTGDGYAMTVAFDGTNVATITVTGLGAWAVNLDDGALTPLP